MNPLGGAVQIAYFVADVDAAAQLWVSRFNAGPFFVAEHIPLSNIVYRGAAGSLDHTSAYGQWDDLMVELVQHHGTAASVFSDRQYGLHHVAAFAVGLDAELGRLAEAGFPTAMTARAGAVRFAFADTTAEFGHYLELYEDAPAIREFYAAIRAAASGWDGRNGVRPIASL